MAHPLFEEAAGVRETYVSLLRSVVEKLEAAEVPFAVEVLVRPNGRDTPLPFCLTRVDALVGDMSAPDVQRVVGDLGAEAAQAFRLPSGLEVQRSPFTWEAVQVVFRSPGFRLEALEAWYQDWIDVEELRQPDPSGLSGVVHDLAWSYDEPDAWTLQLDLGSAPVAAFEEFLAVLHSAGVTHVALSGEDDVDE